MKRILLDKLDIILPPDMQRLCEGAEVYDSSCSTEARVYFIDRELLQVVAATEVFR